jgi:RimJ/RimL family protein N-acetyltransferase
MKLRREQNHDLIVALDAVCFPADERVKPEESSWWVVCDEGATVAYAGLRPCREPFNRGLAFLSRAGVLSSHRGRGLQKRMIRARLREARRLGMHEVVTYCVPENLASANSLIACGFRLYRPEHRWGGSAALYFRKTLKTQ